MPPSGRGRSGSRRVGAPSGSGPSDSKPPDSRLRERRSSVKRSSSGSMSGSKSKASEGASQIVLPSVSSSSSSSSSSSAPARLDSDSDSPCGSYINSDFDSAFESGIESGSEDEASRINPLGALTTKLMDRLGNLGLMLLLFESPSGFALFTFCGVHLYMPDSMDYIWAKFGEPMEARSFVHPRGFLSFKDKSSAINADTGVDRQLVDLIKKWRLPGARLCVGKPEYKNIIESDLKIRCKYCKSGMEIMWGIQHQMRILVPQEKSELTEEDRIPSEGLKKFLSDYGFDVKPEMVNEKIVATAAALFGYDVDDEKNLAFLQDAVEDIQRISGIACEDWDILKLAIAVKVISCPKEELTDFHEVLPEHVLSKLKGDARKYKDVAFKVNWLMTYKVVVSNHQDRIAKKKLLESLVKEAHEAQQAREKGKLHGESGQIPNGLPPRHLVSNPATSLVTEVVRRSPRLNPKLYEDGGCYKGKLHGESGQVPSGLPLRHPTLATAPSLVSNPATCLVTEVVRRSPRLDPKLYEDGGCYTGINGTPKRRKQCCTPTPIAKG